MWFKTQKYGQAIQGVPGISYPNSTEMVLATGQTAGMMGDYYLWLVTPLFYKQKKNNNA